MEDLFFSKSDSNKKAAAKPATTCWACGVEQGRGERFKQCPKCVEYKVIPAKFCSDACFHSSWKRHKAWHAEQKRQLSQVASLPHNPEALAAFAQRSEYDAHLAEANTRINTVDIVGATNVLRKAVTLDSSRPEAYFDLAICSEASGHRKQAAFYYERSIERWALVALTGVIGGGEIEQERHPCWSLEQWSTAIDFVTRMYLTQEFVNHSKPEWFRVDGLLKIVSKIAVDFTKADAKSSMKKKARLSLLQAFAASGIISGGTFHKESSLVGTQSSEDLLEAAACFRFVVVAARAGTDLGLRSQDIDAYSSHVRTCTNLAELKMTQEVSRLGIGGEVSRPATPTVGSWVAIYSRQDESLSDALNGKFGQVLGVPNGEGKVPVKVQDMVEDGPQLLSPASLVESPQNTRANALVACLESDTQWTFMGSIFEALNEQGILPKAGG